MRPVNKLIAFVLLLLAGAIAASAMDRQEQEEFFTSTPTEALVAEESVEPLEPDPIGADLESPLPEVAGDQDTME